MVAACLLLCLVSFTIFWSSVPIHGDGAVYANLISVVAEKGWVFPLEMPSYWHGPFVDHPYLFFYLAGPLSALLGVSDTVVKIPNIVFGVLTCWLAYLCVLRAFGRDDSAFRRAGLFAMLMVGLLPNFEHMVRQPTLDVSAQFWVIFAIFCQLRGAALLSGVLLGLAFWTKGLELLPGLGAVLGLIWWTGDARVDFRNFAIGFFSLIFAWFAIDGFHDWVWTQGYLRRQFAERFMTESNFQSWVTFDFLKRLLRNYQPFALILLVGAGQTFFQGRGGLRSWSALEKAAWLWILLVIAAFSLIKKDSLQHFVPIYIAGGTLCGIYVSRWVTGLQRWGRPLVGAALVLALSTTIYFNLHPIKHESVWWQIARARDRVATRELPVVLSSEIRDTYGFAFTAMWYWQRPIYAQKDWSEVGREVWWVHPTGNQGGEDGFEVVVRDSLPNSSK